MSWAALVAALGALVLAGVAYRRAPGQRPGARGGPPPPTAGRHPRWWLGLVIIAIALVSTVVTLTAGVPGSLPDVALKSSVLFHVERAGALFVAGLLAFVTVYRGWHGELPVEFGREGMRYADVAGESAEGLEKLRDEMRHARDDITSLRDAVLTEHLSRLALEERIRDLGGRTP